MDWGHLAALRRRLAQAQRHLAAAEAAARDAEARFDALSARVAGLGALFSVGVAQEDQDWLVAYARKENLPVPAVINLAVRFFRTWCEQGRHTLQGLADLADAISRQHQQQLKRQHDYYERRLRAATRGHAAVPGDHRVSRLLALALSSDSASEATAALAKARALHRRPTLIWP